MSQVTKYSKRFVKQTSNDLLVIYHRVANTFPGRAYLDWNDIKAITDLFAQTNPVNPNMTILIHTQGGIFQCALGLLTFLRKHYANGEINSAVINIAKSSGAFIAQSSCTTYMEPDAIISDFSMNHNIAINVDKTVSYINTALSLFLSQTTIEHLKPQLDRFQALINSKVHAQNINFDEATLKYGIQPLSNYMPGDWHLREIHNEILDYFSSNPGANKIIGLNGEYVSL